MKLTENPTMNMVNIFVVISVDFVLPVEIVSVRSREL